MEKREQGYETIVRSVKVDPGVEEEARLDRGCPAQSDGARCGGAEIMAPAVVHLSKF